LGGKSVYDLLGEDYTLLRFRNEIDVAPLLNAANQARLPLALIYAPRPAEAAFKHDLLIVRADQHVAWRGNAAPADAANLIAKLSGNAG